jgi:hypothetical protein
MSGPYPPTLWAPIRYSRLSDSSSTDKTTGPLLLPASAGRCLFVSLAKIDLFAWLIARMKGGESPHLAAVVP